MPNAVYWIKGFNTDAKLSFIKWAYGSKEGPRYDDGSCDMDENYSLVIHNVIYADAGHYMCVVSTYKGVLRENFTDVTVVSEGVKTKQIVSFQMGGVGAMPCQVNIRPKMVSWLNSQNLILVVLDLSRGVGKIHGPGYEEGLFNITRLYSLIINNVAIQYEGYFFCEVADFDTGKLYRDETLLTVFAPPRKPFPVIQECPITDQTNCIITTDSPVMLTCYVNQYYPDIDLFFLHGSKRVDTLLHQTWSNADGTKDKNITISANISQDAYKCITSAIPGFDMTDERFSSIRLIQEGQHSQEQNESPIFAVLIVPIVICLAVVLLAWMRLRKKGQHIPRAPTNDQTDLEEKEKMLVSPENERVSNYELWKLIEYAGKFKEEDTLKAAVKKMIKAPLTEDFYTSLRSWKDICDKCERPMNQPEELYKICTKTGMKKSVQQLRDLRQTVSDVADASPLELEHILWQVIKPSRTNITSLFEELEIEDNSTKVASNSGLTEIVKSAVEKLETWKRSVQRNPIVMLSLALEKYAASDQDFFQVPLEDKEPVSEEDVANYAQKVTIKHCRQLFESIQRQGRGQDVVVEVKPYENEEVLFNTSKMITDWLDGLECSNFEKRLRLEAAFLPDEYPEPDNDLFSANVVLAKISGDKSKVVTVAYELLMTDIKPFAKNLGLEESKLQKYKIQLGATPHQMKGTIGLVELLTK